MICSPDFRAFWLDEADQKAFNTHKAGFAFDKYDEFFDVLANARADLRNADRGNPEEFFRKVALQDFAIEALVPRIMSHLLNEIEIDFLLNEIN